MIKKKGISWSKSDFQKVLPKYDLKYVLLNVLKAYFLTYNENDRLCELNKSRIRTFDANKYQKLLNARVVIEWHRAYQYAILLNNRAYGLNNKIYKYFTVVFVCEFGNRNTKNIFNNIKLPYSKVIKKIHK